ncbi:MAG: lipid A biosynthesis acyltransferase [Gammaproteobacteria bacterium]|nr:lipid A biosynthesis acyltransferase [Gammaproteobacteria bacterium]
MIRPRPSTPHTSADPASPGQDWTRQKERSTPFALWLIGAVALTLGRHVARIFIAFAVAWYLVRAWSVRRHVYDFLRRVLPRPPRIRDLVRTYWCFAAVTLDRVFFVAGRDSKFDVRIHNPELLDDLQAQGRGAILLGAHLGSFIALRALAKRRKSMAIRILQYRDQNPAISRTIARLNPDLAEDIIPLGEPDVLLRLERCIRHGQFAALLADRMGPKDTRGVTCDFLGDPVAFPSGGVEAALVLDCPLVLFFGLYRGGNRYELYFERLATCPYADRGERRKLVEDIVERYAGRLAHYARQAPYNWFNFHDYWHQNEEPLKKESGSANQQP